MEHTCLRDKETRQTPRSPGASSIRTWTIRKGVTILVILCFSLPANSIGSQNPIDEFHAAFRNGKELNRDGNIVVAAKSFETAAEALKHSNEKEFSKFWSEALYVEFLKNLAQRDDITVQEFFEQQERFQSLLQTAVGAPMDLVNPHKVLIDNLLVNESKADLALELIRRLIRKNPQQTNKLVRHLQMRLPDLQDKISRQDKATREKLVQYCLFLLISDGDLPSDTLTMAEQSQVLRRLARHGKGPSSRPLDSAHSY